MGKNSRFQRFILIGYSYGTVPVAMLAKKNLPSVLGVILIAPPMGIFLYNSAYSKLDTVEVPLFAVIPNDDQFCSLSTFHEYEDNFNTATVVEADHFFRRNIRSLNIVKEWV